MIAIDYTGCLRDYRLEKRGNNILEQMLIGESAILHRLSTTHSHYVSDCSFFKRDKVDYQKLIQPLIEQTAIAAAGKSVIVGSDTTEINYEDHAAYLSRKDPDLGPVGNNEDIGFFMHPSIVLDEENEMLLGVSNLHIWNRNYEKGNKLDRKYSSLPIEEKESYRWIACAQASKIALAAAASILFVSDREADMYELFATVPDERSDVLIRNRANRKLFGSVLRLWEFLAAQNPAGKISLTIRNANKRKGRQTTLTVKYSKVQIERPQRLDSSPTPDYIEMYVVEVKEIVTHLPEGEKLVHWILLTSREIESLQDALYLARCYGLRWQIELVFATLKSKGLDLEASELETGRALKSLAAMTLITALKINQLRLGRDRTDLSAKIVFSEKQILLLHLLVKKLEGQTEIQKNRYTTESLAWAVWAIAKLGGWKGYAKNESPPGNKTMLWGWNKFLHIFEGWEFAQMNI
jgi:hypothetical protein